MLTPARTEIQESGAPTATNNRYRRPVVVLTPGCDADEAIDVALALAEEDAALLFLWLWPAPRPWLLGAGPAYVEAGRSGGVAGLNAALRHVHPIAAATDMRSDAVDLSELLRDHDPDAVLVAPDPPRRRWLRRTTRAECRRIATMTAAPVRALDPAADLRGPPKVGPPSPADGNHPR
ncbi:hypothetical protein DSM112329_04239 [Paraconexibacter sp. AEG42_29]|uniref:UspA domain-containing protein n=1 Tax=Paraconexibacter sp. AEG42_29 TaxID=2997339 RepID=A0AAU7B080_9ACTN